MVGLRDSAPLVALNVAAVLLLLLTLAHGFSQGRVADFGLIDHALVPLKATAPLSPCTRLRPSPPQSGRHL